MWKVKKNEIVFFSKTVLIINVYIRKNNLAEVHPQVNCTKFLLTPVTNCSAEWSFSTLKRPKSYLRSTMKAYVSRILSWSNSDQCSDNGYNSETSLSGN